ncbi:MAG: 30S ribosomal protein S7 [Ignavibacteria bacterium CG_4_8_14_3_um_filter_37_9]|nr:30S ribosomal protein S7 [Ignavibacteria bacterium]NCS82384.1 30S ribosomal protein S7 [Ignavibacteria bacterium]PIP79295.1 MAG: 30S ribosomal protein S7 [Ignavibacteria bacterium CG22_combo_CG10-13_8_21_14_all_37_15]PIW99518.1 MAG: 30S ribosomal protein S7 [Ignavibacteria bacterium CG_4_8_14_3_um_filter_37_9]
MRKKRAEKRYVKPDPKFNDMVVAKFVNAIMYEGKKSVARDIVYTAFDILEEKTKKPGVEVFKKAMSNVQPLIEVRSRRVGGATYQVPMEVRPERRIALAMRWIKIYARKRSEKSMSVKLANELLAASNNEGSSVKKKEETHKMAEANKAFAHFKW